MKHLIQAAKAETLEQSLEIINIKEFSSLECGYCAEPSPETIIFLFIKYFTFGLMILLPLSLLLIGRRRDKKLKLKNNKNFKKSIIIFFILLVLYLIEILFIRNLEL